MPVETSYSITLSASELGVVGEGLGLLAYRAAAPLIHKINEQLAAADKANAERMAKAVPDAAQPSAV